MTPAERVRQVLLDNGLGSTDSQDDSGEVFHGSIHSWRCSWPDIYGECDCLDRLVADLVAVMQEVAEV